ncbi:MAG TPA: hypothetical protein VHB54_13045 [Mucilaginibacter sp.]|nr:hypothetical protein [Mucilaginibacter sp.]
MTPRSFFAIVIKIIAIYLIVESLAEIPQLLGTLMSFFQIGGFSGSGIGGLIVPLFWIALIVAFYIFFFRLCLFKTDWIIDKLKLDRGFDEEKFEINMHRSVILKIVIIVVGALMAADSLPQLCKQVFAYFQSSAIYSSFKTNLASGWIVYYFVKFSIGLFLMSANRIVVNFIELKRKETTQNTELE